MRSLLLIAAVCIVCSLAKPLSAQDQAIADRAAAMLMGAFVADAASMPLHWIYDTQELARLAQSGIEFHNPPSCPYYKYPLGNYSLYGQQATIYINTIAKSGTTDPASIESAYYQYYTVGPCRPGIGCYLDTSTKGFLANEAAGKHWPNCGSTDDQADAIVHAMIVVALMAGDPNMLPTAANIIRVTQNADRAVAFGLGAARILEQVVLHGTAGIDAVKNAITDMQSPTRVSPTQYDSQLAQGLQHVLSELNKKNIDVCLEIGQSCEWPNNLWTGAHLIAQNPGYVNGTRQTILAGGDSCSRNMFVEGFNAALLGLDAIPADWRTKTNDYANTWATIQKLVSLRKPLH